MGKNWKVLTRIFPYTLQSLIVLLSKFLISGALLSLYDSSTFSHEMGDILLSLLYFALPSIRNIQEIISHPFAFLMMNLFEVV